MPSPAGTPIKLDRDRTLRYTERALVRFEDATGMTITEAALRMQSLSIKATSAVLWAGLVHEDPDLTLDAAIDLVDLTRIEEILETLDVALERSFGASNGAKPDADAGGQAGPKAADAPAS